MNHHYFIHIEGLVQGVGFRPFIYQLAQEHGLSGCVDNRNDGVYIELDCSGEEVKRFIRDILSKKPEIAHIRNYAVSRLPATSGSKIACAIWLPNRTVCSTRL